MNVRELIEELSKHDPELTVVIAYDGRYAHDDGITAEAIGVADRHDLFPSRDKGPILIIDAC